MVEVESGWDVVVVAELVWVLCLCVWCSQKQAEDQTRPGLVVRAYVNAKT